MTICQTSIHATQIHVSMAVHARVNHGKPTSVHALLTIVGRTVTNVSAPQPLTVIIARYSQFWDKQKLQRVSRCILIADHHLFMYVDINPCEPSPCLHGGTCIRQSNNDYTCQCTVDFKGPNCNHCK